MATATDTERLVLQESQRDKTVEPLQKCLTTLIDLALQLKQAHWNLIGHRFLSVHVQLDSIIETARTGSDDVAERIATLAVAADGRAETIQQESKLERFPEGRHDVETTISLVADRLATASACLRDSIKKVGEVDPVSEDLLIGICSDIEKHLWMVQSQEVDS